MSESKTPEETATNIPNEVDANDDGPESAASSPVSDNVPGSDEASAATDAAATATTEAYPTDSTTTEPEPEPEVQPMTSPPPPPPPIKKPKTNSSRRRKVYDIISMPADKSMDDFIKMVNDRLSSKKYVPIGGVTFDEHKNVYIQAISLVQPEVKNKKYTRRVNKY
jgi:hypothetical protein